MVAGLLTFLSLLYLPDLCVSGVIQADHIIRGLQLQVQFWTFTRFPFIMAAFCHQIAKSGEKVRKKSEKWEVKSEKFTIS